MVALQTRPPEPAADPRPAGRTHHLPAQPTPLVGRDQDVAAIAARLLESDIRLLTLTGPPGTGKTRLSIAVAADVAAGFEDGAWFVRLESVRGPDEVLGAIAQALGLREPGGQPPAAALAANLAARRALLVLDNFEHVIAASRHIAGLLGACPRLHVLVTSRAPLRLRWEHLWPVGPLSVPAPAAALQSAIGAAGDPGLDPERLLDYAAIRLFVQRARAVRPDFSLTEENAGTVAAICARLDGLPLALELAAARVRLLSPRAILDRLSQRLDLLTSGAHDLPVRQRTLRAALDWSHELLTPAERSVFRGLAVFAGGCTVDAAAAVVVEPETKDSPADAAFLDVLDSLVEKSLVRREATAGPDEPVRLRMLETVREYALEQLVAADQLADVQRRHATLFLALAEAAEPHFTGAEQAAWLARLEAEHDNIRAALAWSLEAGEHELCLRTAGALWRFWEIRGYLGEGRAWLQRALEQGADASKAARAKALVGAGALARDQRDLEQAELLHREGLALWRALGDTQGIAIALNNLGTVAADHGEYGRSTDLFEESLALWRDLGDAGGIALLRYNLGFALERQGDLQRATPLLEESLQMYRQLGDTRGVGRALSILGSVALKAGDYARSTALTKEGLALRWQIGEKEGVAMCLERLAGTARAQAHLERSVRLLAAADALRQAIGAPVAPAGRAERERLRDGARAGLGDGAFAAAWAAGRAMRLEQVIAEALAGGEERAARSAAVRHRPAGASPTPSRSSLPGGLTAREAEVLRLIAEGHTNREIAAELVLSVATVERHISNLYSKVGARGRADATAYALSHALA